MTFGEIVGKVDSFAWGPVMLVLLVGTGIFYSIRSGFLQFSKLGYWMKNTLGKIFKKTEAGEGEVTPFQAMPTALAATVGTGNIVGVTGAIIAGGPGAVFWMWVSALFGMCTKYAEVVLAVRYRERNAEGDWVGGPMYYIKNGLGKSWVWLAVIFSLLGGLASFGIGNMTQINSIASSITNAIDNLGGAASSHTFMLFGQSVAWSNLIVGIVVAVLTGLVLLGGLKRIGSVTEKLVPFMALVYIIASIIVLVCNGKFLGQAFGLIFSNAFTVKAAYGGAVGVVLMTTIKKGVGRGVFSNEAGLGSAPMAHAATSEKNPVMQGMYGVFEVFMDTIVICSMTSLVLLSSICRGGAITEAFEWGGSGGSELIAKAFGSVLGDGLGSLIIAVGIALFAFSTLLSWSLYGKRCWEYLFGAVAGKIYQIVFIIVVVIGATLNLQVVWDIADALNGFMAIPNLIALLALSGVVIKLTKRHFRGEGDEIVREIAEEAAARNN